MIARTIVAAALSLGVVCQAVPAVSAPPLDQADYKIVAARRTVSAGEHLDLRLSPPPPDGARVIWGASAAGFRTAVYRAPFIIPAGAPPVRVTVDISVGRARSSTSIEVELIPGSVSGASDCLGPNQSFSPTHGALEPDYVYVDELPELIHKVAPEYPRSSFARGSEDTIVVNALVCRGGRVLDAYQIPQIRRDNPSVVVETDPKLAEAALAAVRQYVFKPALVAGQPVAVWVTTPVRFSR